MSGYPYSINNYRKYLRGPLLLVALCTLIVLLIPRPLFAFSYGCEASKSEESTFFNPRIAVRCEMEYGIAPLAVTSSDSTVLSAGECRNLWITALPTRVCARIARPGQNGNVTDRIAGCDVNKTLCGRDQLCTYEDPIDATDLDEGTSIFHENSDGSDLTKMMGDYKYLMLAGGISGALALGGSELISKQNRVVLNDISPCVDFPLSPLPPPFAHNISLPAYQPLPKVKAVPTSLDTKTGEPPVADGIASSFERSRARAIVFSNKNMYIRHLDLSAGECALFVGDGREFCAYISTNDPKLICIKQKSPEKMAGCITRPNMPLPTITAVPQTGGDTKVIISLGSPAQTSEPLPYKDASVMTDQRAINNCTNPPLYGMKLCANMACKTYNAAPDNSTPLCAEPDDKICVSGYPNDLVVALKGVTLGTDKNGTPRKAAGAIVEAAPNRKGVDGKWRYYPPNFTDNTSPYYVNPATYNPDETNLSKNPYYINTSTQEVRQKTSEEMGLCVAFPTPGPETFDTVTPGTSRTETYAIKPSCKKLSVKLWGGGAAGQFTTACGSAACDHSGGAGGYAEAILPVTRGDSYSITVGAGGQTKGANGSNSSIALGSNILVFAQGGQGMIGGNGGGSASGITLRKGGDGGNALETLAEGGKAYGETAASYGVCIDLNAEGLSNSGKGAGGCAADDFTYAYQAYVSSGGTNGLRTQSTWAKGGDGRVTVECVP